MLPDQTAYAAAGVDIEAGDRAVELMKASVAKTRRPEVLGRLGGFAGLFDASRLATLDQPVLATSTDGVGTKVAIASGHGYPPHHRLRPGRHGGRRPGGVWGRAAVHDRLHRVWPGRARADRGHRQGHRRGVCRGGLCPARRRDRGASGTARAGRIRHRRGGDRSGGEGQDPRRRAGAAGRRGAGDRVVRSALQRLLPGQAGVADGRLVPRPPRARARPDHRRRAARRRPGSTAWTAWP